MANFNKVILLGNLTRDMEMRYTQSGTAVGKVGMAINRKYTQNGETKESTCFVDLTAWGRSAEIISQYTSKGSQLFVEGRLEFSTWEDKKGGGKRSKLEVVIDNFQLMGGGQRSGGAGGAGDAASGKASGGSSDNAAAGGEADFEGIPF